MRIPWPFDLDELEPTIVVAVGLVLVIIPDPATSTLGAGLVLFGIAWWFQEWRD
jgi:hypothetical protein